MSPVGSATWAPSVLAPMASRDARPSGPPSIPERFVRRATAGLERRPGDRMDAAVTAVRAVAARPCGATCPGWKRKVRSGFRMWHAHGA